MENCRFLHIYFNSYRATCSRCYKDAKVFRIWSLPSRNLEFHDVSKVSAVKRVTGEIYHNVQVLTVLIPFNYPALHTYVLGAILKLSVVRINQSMNRICINKLNSH